MVQKTIFEACTEAADSLGLENLTSIIGSSNASARRLLAKARESATALRRRHDWETLCVEDTFTTVAAEEQGDMSTIAPDFDRFANETMWNRTQARPLEGPYTAREWQAMKASLAISTATDNFRIRGNKWLIYPAPSAGDTIAYEYVSNKAISEDAGSTWELNAFAADTNVFKLDGDMWVLDIIWRYRQSRGLSYAEDFRSAELMIADRISNDGGRRRVQMGAPKRVIRPRAPTISDGNWTL